MEHLQDLAIPGRLVPPANWHLTLRFLGEVDQMTCDRYVAGLDQAALGESFKVELRGMGAFPRPEKATVVWVGVGRGSLQIHQLAEIADGIALDSGLLGEERPYRPHLTVSRVRPPAKVVQLIEEVDFSIEWRVREVVLFETVPGRGSVAYEPLETFPLTR